MRAVVLGVSGMTGRAVAAALADAGHEVVGTGRSPGRFPAVLRERGVAFVRSDRDDPAQVRAVLADGADVVVDVVAYTAAHARSVLEASGDVGSVVVLSSKAVYTDARGRHSNSDHPPDFGGPVGEDTPTLPPDWSGAYDSREGYGRNKAAVEEVYRGADVPVSVLRPSRIHGPGSARPRERWVVDRVLAGQRTFRLPHAATAGNHPTAAANLAALALLCAQRPAHRVLNAADPGTPTAAEVVTAVAAAMGLDVEVDDDDGSPGGEVSPWSTWPPFFLDTSASEAAGYRPVGTHAATVGACVAELVRRSRSQPDRSS
ncbi:NAD-dependent epimerase/dehydratase family protein [Quadrisphaera oryzae]|uniref:NAD-dependent epimerase/dehydratase family protein n=1 Tax=Quadrisphaera TaxID=317661 RepID=UPI001645DA3C|nr:NAD-dependent epimerase/dehydratase family protein [Quadrisphaera sp. RL12-1S]